MFCMALAQENNYSDVDDANKKEIHKYKKKTRRTAKQLKGRRGSASAPAPSSISPQAKKKRRLPIYICIPSGLTLISKG